MSVVVEARRVLGAEADAIRVAAQRLGPEFDDAVRLLGHTRMVHVSGIGKSGHVARKIAGTMCSTGTPANFLHPVEALHGDLGLVRARDAALLVSRSGECDEVLAVADALAGLGVHLVALTTPGSRLDVCSDVVLDCSADEACPLGLAPTSSTAVAMAMGDALALVLMQRSGFGADAFRRSHPGGVLGQ